MTIARCSFELKGCGFSHLPIKPVLGITVSMPRPPAYEMTVRKMMLTDTLCGLNKNTVANAEPKADRPRPRGHSEHGDQLELDKEETNLGRRP